MTTNINGRRLRVDVDETTFSLLPKSTPTPVDGDELVNKNFVDSITDYSSHLTYSPPIPAPLGVGYTSAAMIQLNTGVYVMDTYAKLAKVGSSFTFGTSNLVLTQIQNQFSWDQDTGYLTCLIPGNYVMMLLGLTLISGPTEHFFGPAVNDDPLPYQRLCTNGDARYFHHAYFLTLNLNDTISFLYNQDSNDGYDLANFSVCLTKRN